MPRYSVGPISFVVTLVLGAGSGLAQSAPPQEQEVSASGAQLSPNERLQQAAMNGDLAAVRAAISEKAGIDELGGSRMTALGIAALYGHADVIRALVAAGAKVSADQDGDSALAVAAREGHTAALEALLEAGADIEAKDANGITPLMSAASANRAEAVRVLLAKGAESNAVNNDGATALIAAAYGGHLEAADALLSGGADLSLRDRSGRTALMAAALGGNAEVSQLLLDHHADPNAEDRGGLNALVYAASAGHERVALLLQEAGVRKGSDLALAYAVRGCRIPLATRLLTGGASVDARLSGRPLLTLAAAANCREGVDLVLSHQADVNAKDDEGSTALMRAAAAGFAEMVQLLLDKGADMELTNNESQSAWLLAAGSNQLEVIEILRRHRNERQGNPPPDGPDTPAADRK
ncbi:MAG: ankyrin repeat domain-containing protein [Vicinamibacterales bacterium]